MCGGTSDLSSGAIVALLDPAIAKAFGFEAVTEATDKAKDEPLP